MSQSAQVLARNTLWSLLGQAAPVLAAIVTIPVLVAGLGVERFGILTLAWMVAGYFSLFDFGLGRGLTKLVAERIATGRVADSPPLVWTGLGLMAGLGALGALSAWAAAPWLVHQGLRVPPSLVPEAIPSFQMLALSIPAVILTAGFRGVLEATQSFGVVTALRIPMGIFNFAGPAGALLFTRRLDVLIAVLVAGRVVAAAAHFLACWTMIPELLRPISFDRRLAGPLLSFGGWMTVSNIISPMMSYVDRFLIAGVVSMSAVAYYVTPYEVVTKLWMIPGALAAVLFPAFAGSMAQDPERAEALLERGSRYVFLALFPAVLALVVLASPGLELWLGSEFRTHGTRPMQWLAAGVLLNSLAVIPFAFVQGAGRPDWTARLHLAEVLPYLFLLWWSVDRFGIAGAAAAWFARVAVDAVALVILSARVTDRQPQVIRVLGPAGVGLLVLLIGAVIRTDSVRVAYLAGALAVFAMIAWRALLNGKERSAIRSLASRVWLAWSRP